MTGPAGPADPDERADPFERALVAAFQPPGEVRVCPTAGVRLRGRVARRRADRVAFGLAGCVVLLAVAALGVGVMLRDGRAPVSTMARPPAPAADRGDAGSEALARGGPGVGVPVLPSGAQPAEHLDMAGYQETVLTNPLKILEVTSAVYRLCPQPGDGTCPALTGPVVLVVRRLLSAVEVTRVAGTSTVGVVLTLGEPDRATFAEYTRTHRGSQVAFVVDGRTWSTARIKQPVTTGVIQIVAGSAESDASNLVRILDPWSSGVPPWRAEPEPW